MVALKSENIIGMRMGKGKSKEKAGEGREDEVEGENWERKVKNGKGQVN